MTRQLYTLRDPQSILGTTDLKSWFKTDTLLGEELTIFSVFIKDGVATLTAKNRQTEKKKTVAVQSAMYEPKRGFTYLLLSNKALVLLKPATETTGA